MEIQNLLESYRSEIERGEVKVLSLDECHLMSGDLEGYVWGTTGKRVEVPIVNERERQTYYGALDLVSQQLTLQAYPKGNSDYMVSYLNFLLTQWPKQRLIILWDGASYHRSAQIQEFLAQLNDGLAPEQWRIRCVRFAPNDPTQNPIEDAWLQAKNWLWRFSGLRPSFSGLKALFAQFFTLEIFDFPKVHLYGSFSLIN